jgi:hypothetical protein
MYDASYTSVAFASKSRISTGNGNVLGGISPRQTDANANAAATASQSPHMRFEK